MVEQSIWQRERESRFREGETTRGCGCKYNAESKHEIIQKEQGQEGSSQCTQEETFRESKDENGKKNEGAMVVYGMTNEEVTPLAIEMATDESDQKGESMEEKDITQNIDKAGSDGNLSPKQINISNNWTLAI
ncbi:hypothetical protein KY289_005018 [Solanum tuberosum]|nr:hypothetical protein KY289_005018 [Solanum tuberosum]